MERLRQMVHCPECGVNLAAIFLMAHHQPQNGVGHGKATPPPPQGGGERKVRVRDETPAQYRVSFPTILSQLRCPGEVC